MPDDVIIGADKITLPQKFGRLGLKLIGYLSFFPPLLTRLLMGYAFYLTGKGKLSDVSRVTEFFTGLGIPFPAANAAFISNLEYYGGILLILGLCTRPIAALLASTMAVALMTAERADFLSALSGIFGAESKKDLSDITPVIYGAFLVWLVIYGPGLISLDAIIRKLLRIDKPKPDAAS